MIIYHTAPIRCFPLLVEQLTPQFANPYHFRMPLEARSVADHRFGMLHHAFAYDYTLSEVPRAARPNNGFPHSILDNGIDFVEPSERVPIDFLYGVFDGRLIDKQPGDFVFTIISHPVRHIYDLFQYLAHVNRSTAGRERHTEGIALFDDVVAGGITGFVDRFLADDRDIACVDGRRFALIDDAVRFNARVPYDFVGVEANIEHTIATLSAQLGLVIAPSDALVSRRSSIGTDCTYRYDDLARKLAPEVAMYESLAS